MALEHNKTVNLTAESKINETVVARFSAIVNSDTEVSSAYSEQILDTTVYGSNKAAVRKDIEEFRNLIYGIEDELAAETVEEE